MTASARPRPRSSRKARETGAHVIGLSILSGSHVPLVREVKARLRRRGARPHPGRRRRHHLGRGRERAAQHGRRRGLHAEGLRARRHHGRHGAGGGAGGGAAGGECASACEKARDPQQGRGVERRFATCCAGSRVPFRFAPRPRERAAEGSRRCFHCFPGRMQRKRNADPGPSATSRREAAPKPSASGEVIRARPAAPRRGRETGPRASSIPVDSRSRSGGQGVPGPSTEARCSIRLSTPPSEVARFHKLTRAAVAIAGALAAGDLDRQHGAEAALHLARGDVVAGMLRQARVEHAGDVRMRRQALGERLSARRLRRRAQMQRAHAAHQEIGLERPEDRALALADRRRCALQNASCRAVTSAPATTSEWPFRIFVAACMTMSAPSASGRVCTGEAAVESTASRAPAAMRDLGRGGDVGDGPERVRRRLDPDELGLARPHRRFERREIVGLDEVDAQAPARRLGGEPVAQRPVHHPGRDDVVAGVERLEHGGRRRHAGGEEQRLGAPSSSMARTLSACAHRGVVGPAVDEAGANRRCPRRG